MNDAGRRATSSGAIAGFLFIAAASGHGFAYHLHIGQDVLDQVTDGVPWGVVWGGIAATLALAAWMWHRTRATTRRDWQPLIGLVIAAGIVIWPHIPEWKHMTGRNYHAVNSRAAVHALSQLAAGQAEFQQRAWIDLDGDGIGEFGRLNELTGSTECRGGKRVPREEPLIPAIFGVLDHRGVAQRSGYYFAIHLPPAADVDANEQRWRIYAWPAPFGLAADNVFMMDQDGEIYGTYCDAAKYGQLRDDTPDGVRVTPPPNAAYDAAGEIASQGSGRTATDGNTWFHVPR